MKLFGSLRWDGGAGCFYRFKGGSQPKKFEKHCTRASLHSDTVEGLIRISVEGGLRSTALERPFVQTQWKI